MRLNIAIAIAIRFAVMLRLFFLSMFDSLFRTVEKRPPHAVEHNRQGMCSMCLGPPQKKKQNIQFKDILLILMDPTHAWELCFKLSE